TWVDRGVYDDLITGLGDGMAAGLTVGLGEQGTDSVFRRAFSVLVLAECIDRDNQEGLLPADKLLEWGDRIASWYLRERDLRGFVAGKGWAHAVVHGADAIGVLGRSPHLGRNELTVLLDGIDDRLLAPVDQPFGHGEPDRIALATMTLLRRNGVPLHPGEPWVARIAPRAAVCCVSPWSSRGSPGAPPAPSTRPTVRATRSPGRPTPRRSCGPSTSSWPSRRHRPTSGPTCCWCSSRRCARPTRRTCPDLLLGNVRS